MKYFDIIREKAMTDTSFDLGNGNENKSNVERFADGCADTFVDSIMSGYASI